MKRLWLIPLASLGFAGVANAEGLDDAKAGFAAAKRGEYQAAIYFSSLAITSGELNVKTLAIAHNNRGYAHDILGASDRAIQDYGEAIRINPKFAVAYNNRVRATVFSCSRTARLMRAGLWRWSSSRTATRFVRSSGCGREVTRRMWRRSTESPIR